MKASRQIKLIEKAFEKFHYKRRKSKMWEQKYNLQLSLKTKWFDLTKAGVKLEEYRELTPYWIKRLCKEDFLAENTFCNGSVCFNFKDFTTTTLTLGYPKSTDTERIIKFENAGIEIGYGKEEWGAEPNKLYFIIKHGKRL